MSASYSAQVAGGLHAGLSILYSSVRTRLALPLGSSPLTGLMTPPALRRAPLRTLPLFPQKGLSLSPGIVCIRLVLYAGSPRPTTAAAGPTRGR